MSKDKHKHQAGGEPAPIRRRRVRYSGTHPREFEQKYKEREPQRYPAMHEHVRRQGRTPAGSHVPIMVEEVLAALRPSAGDVVADCTVGYGGHAEAFLERIGPTGRLIGLDIDGDQLMGTAKRLHADLVSGGPATAQPPASRARSRARLHRCHFAGLAKVMKVEGIDGFDVILADLGVSSMQIDDPARGFSYQFDGPLDMRMDQRNTTTASDILMSASETELSEALWGLADEPDHQRIARRIVQYRAKHRIARTRQLVQLIFEAKQLTPVEWRREKRKGADELHPATRTFQAMRILVNDELTGLEQFLRVAPYCLRPGGRMGLISFHSGEHERIEASFRAGLESGVYEAVSVEPIRPSAQERFSNPRSRSAQLRWARSASSG
jgi:16S rRNA (cytosine1402-N4)-methyltransferase